jgi:hypothetical protein
VSVAPTALSIVIDGYPALPGWADVWPAGPPGLEAVVGEEPFFLAARVGGSSLTAYKGQMIFAGA